MINNKILGLLGLCTRAGKLVFGTDACTDVIKKRNVKLVMVAEDAADRTKRNFEFLCRKNEIPICFFGTMEEISKAIGNRNKVVVAVKDPNFANEMKKIINGGEIIG